MSADQRLERLYPALSAKERALMVLQAFKVGEEPEELIYSTTPSEQGHEFNRLINLVNAVNVELAPVILLIREQIAKSELKYAWLTTLRLWADDMATLRLLVGLDTKEPITASDYAVLGAAARDELLPLRECVQILIEDHAWDDADCFTNKDGERNVSTKARNRVDRATREHLTTLVADGTLPSRKRGRGIRIPAGVFYDWRGEQTPVYPEVAREYDVRPDEEAADIDDKRDTQAAIRRVLDRAPIPLESPLDTSPPAQPIDEAKGFGSELERILVMSICDLLRQHWCDARTVDIAVREVAQEFDGEDPLALDTRAMLDACLFACEKLRADMAYYVEVALVEPQDEDVALVRNLIEKAAG